MRSYENYCVGCPQGCINCGRKNDVLIISCDKCGAEDKPVYEYDGKELCIDCITADGEMGICEDCGEEAMLIDGLCGNCLEVTLDEIGGEY